MGIHPASFGDHFGWDPVSISHQHMALILRALKHQGGRWRTSPRLQITRRQDAVLGARNVLETRSLSTCGRWRLCLGHLRGPGGGLHLVSQTGVGWQQTGPQHPDEPQQLDPQQPLPQPPQPEPQPEPQQPLPQQPLPQPPQPEPPQPQQEPQQDAQQGPQQPQQAGWQQHTSQQSWS